MFLGSTTVFNFSIFYGHLCFWVRKWNVLTIEFHLRIQYILVCLKSKKIKMLDWAVQHAFSDWTFGPKKTLRNLEIKTQSSQLFFSRYTLLWGYIYICWSYNQISSCPKSLWVGGWQQLPLSSSLGLDQ